MGLQVTEDSGLVQITSESKRLIQSRIQEIISGGGTNLSGGLFKGIEQQLKGDVSARSIRRVILFTDGLANEGEHSYHNRTRGWFSTSCFGLICLRLLQ